jgi:hypothetical protein
MGRTALLALSALALLALSGCGNSGGPAAYLHADPGEVVFIQWQQSSSGQLQGTVTEDQVSGTAPNETISASSAPFTGNANGSSVSLTLHSLLGFAATLVGTLSGNTLALQVPQSGGTIRQQTFAAAGVSSFNAAVAALRGRVHRVNVQAAAALVRQRQRAARAAAAAKARAVTAANKQAASNTAADAVAHADCKQFGGQWSAPGPVDYTADGYTLTINGGPQDASCDNVPYLGSDDATYYLSVNFAGTGAAEPVSGWTGTARQSDCDRGWYPQDSTGPSYAKPGNWSSILGLCLTNG